MTETLANGYSFESTQPELYNEYQHDRVKIVLTNFRVLVLWTKIVSALDGLRVNPEKGVCIQPMHRVVNWLALFRRGRDAGKESILRQISDEGVIKSFSLYFRTTCKFYES